MAQLMIAGVDTAYRAKTVSGENAPATAEGVASDDDRPTELERGVVTLDGWLTASCGGSRRELEPRRWMVGANAALAVLVLVGLFVR